MKVISFMRQGFELAPIEVELSLTAGLPQIIFMGLPDTQIRESVARIKSALKHQGFEPPAARQVLVHLRPTHIRKTSRGLDLAVAAALLWETGQLPMPNQDDGTPCVYGELTLKGEILRPDDLEDVEPDEVPSPVLTGVGKELPFALRTARDLRSLASPHFLPARNEVPEFEKPPIPEISLSAACADVLACAVAGEHHVLLAGPPGSGKTTAVELVRSLMEPPPPDVFAHSRRVHRLSGEDLRWRPFIQPHHSVSGLAMVGGGQPPRPGEITRAHGGCLVMDEFLEFHPRVQEALREPIERGSIRLARGTCVRQYPARFLLLGTTNLCPCGRYVPGRDELCRCARARRAAYGARLKGPFLDRFSLLAFTDGWSRNLDVPATDVALRIRAATLFRQTHRNQQVPNQRLDEAALVCWLTEFQRRELLAPVVGSRRRHLAVLRAARTFADLDLSETIQNSHLEKAIEIGQRTFSDIERMEG